MAPALVVHVPVVVEPPLAVVDPSAAAAAVHVVQAPVVAGPPQVLAPSGNPLGVVLPEGAAGLIGHGPHNSRRAQQEPSTQRRPAKSARVEREQPALPEGPIPFGCCCKAFPPMYGTHVSPFWKASLRGNATYLGKHTYSVSFEDGDEGSAAFARRSCYDLLLGAVRDGKATWEPA